MFRVARNVERKIIATRRSTTHNYKDGSVVAPSLPQPTKLTPQQLDERRAKGLCFNYDNKYSKRHKCTEKKLFCIDFEEEEEQEQEQVEVKPTQETKETTPTISCHALVGITTPQTIRLKGYIKKANSLDRFW